MYLFSCYLLFFFMTNSRSHRLLPCMYGLTESLINGIAEVLTLLTSHQIVKAMLGEKEEQETEKILFSKDVICTKMINI